jgi:fermentation-respiration switch protein FrsA (DUF1100 family)
MNAVKWIVVIGLGGYAAFVVALYFGQRFMLYLPQPRSVSPAAAGLPEAEAVTLETGDGERVVAWHVPPRSGRPIVIYFHGAVVGTGAGLLAVSYRGYMGSTGRPTEHGLLADAEAAYRFAASRYAPERIVLWGHSLGSGVAVALASTRPVAKLVLEAPFSSTVDVAAAMFPFVPVRWLMLDQFHSDARIGTVKASILILHGARDLVVPIRFGERLFALASEPKRFVRYPDGGHDDLDAYGATAEALRFIAGQPTLGDLTKNARGSVDSGVPDLASNPEHFKGFGRD